MQRKVAYAFMHQTKMKNTNYGKYFALIVVTGENH